MNTAANDRVERLTQARRIDSKTKRQRTLDVLDEMLDAGQRVTFVGLARQAGVSTWLLYNVDELKTSVQKAIASQSGSALAKTSSSTLPPSVALTELAIARSEIHELRSENKKLTARLQLTLGAELDEVDQSQLIDRIHQLEELVATLRAERDDVTGRVETLDSRAAALTEEVAVLEALNRKYIIEINKTRREKRSGS
ncbi:DUF6262 family protein [Gordonia sputi]|uniref:DUF6262 family protein n=1 Tax=Gordonia sputi TaxID=36823 RepID=UPI00226D5CC1|nr:DUF6262 family protein [Gordonia sputi]